MNTATTTPNVEERLCAAAFDILTDGHRHEHRARVWAVRFLRRAARGRETAFLRRIRTARAHAFGGRAAA